MLLVGCNLGLCIVGFEVGFRILVGVNGGKIDGAPVGLFEESETDSNRS